MVMPKAGHSAVLRGRSLRFEQPIFGGSFFVLHPFPLGEYVRTLIRASLASVLSLFVFVGPVSAATTQAVTVAQATQSGTISGHVTSDSGSGLAGANIIIDGSGQHQSTTTDDSGNFTVSVPAGLYTITIVKAGYSTGSYDTTVISNQSVAVSAVLAAVTLNNLNVIGRTTSTSARNAARFNISSTAQQSLTQTQLIERNTPDLTGVVNELPGITIPHATTNPNQGFVIRGLRYETRVTLDGHPISSGTSGTFLTNYAAGAIFGGVDVLKGGGLNGPISGEAGAGLVNLRTPDFSGKNQAFVQGALDSYGGSLYTALVSVNFLKDNKLSLVLGRTFSGYRGPTYGLNEPNYSGALIPSLQTFSAPQNLTNGVVSYIQDFSNTYALNSELAKLRYKFSDATSLSLEFLGLQGQFNPQGGAYGQFDGYATIPQCLNANVAGNGAACTVTSTYGSPGAANLVGQTGVPLYAFFPGSNVAQNQPNFSADFKTTFKNDTILFRPYTAAINRLIDGTGESRTPGNGGAWSQVTNSANCQTTFVAATVANGGAKGPCFAANQTPIAAFVNDPATPHVFDTSSAALTCTVAAPCYTTPTGLDNSGRLGFGSPFTTLELDKLFGYTFSYIHPVGANTYNLSFDHYFDDATAFTNDASPLLAGCQFVIQSGQANTPGLVGYQPSCPLATLRPSPLSVPETFSSVSSLSATAQLQLTPKLRLDLGGFYTKFLINAQVLAPIPATYGLALRTGAFPATLVGATNAASHIDPHMGLSFRPSRDLALRFTAGSSMVIPYASLVSGFSTYAQGSSSTTITSPNIALRPEEVVNLDLGGDFRTPDGTVISADVYNTVVHNPWLFTKVLICNCALPGLEPTAQTFASQTLNGAEQYAQGVEFSISKLPAVGFGYRVNGSLERNYYLHTSPTFLSSPQAFYNGAQLASTGSGITSVPYAKGYAEVSYTDARKSMIRMGVDYEGSNNSYNAPAFFVFDAGIRANTGFHDVMLGATVENLFNTNFNSLLGRGIAFQGLAPVAATAVTNGYAYSTPFNTGLVSPGFTTYRFTLTKQF